MREWRPPSSLRDIARSLFAMLETSWRADAPRSVLAVVTASGQMVTMPVRAFGLKILADSVLASDAHRVVRAALFVAGVESASRLSAWASFNTRMRLREQTMLLLDQRLMALVSGVPGVEHHERPDYLDRVELLRSERGALANPFNPISWTLASLVQGAATLTLLSRLDRRLLVLPAFAGVSIWLTAKVQRIFQDLRESQAEPNRILRHLLELTTEAPAGKEIRVFGLASELVERRRRLFNRLERERVRAELRATSLWAGGGALFALGYVGAIVIVVRGALAGRLTAGDVVLTLALGAQINQQLAELAGNVTWFVRTNRAVRRYLWLVDYARDVRAALQPAQPLPAPTRLADGIRFKDVTFAYPGTDRPVLRDVNLHFPAGATIAVVGENGAGKTTIVKLLCRLYEPSSGAILVDGQDLRRFEVDEWRTRLAAGFQDFARFELLARESAGVGDVAQVDSADAVLAALVRASAADVADSLPSGIETQLGREFEGVELSIGQWQKLALGRAMMRESPLVLMLDEPTASLDANTEHALFERFTDAARRAADTSGAITILVSHRFSTVRMADLILVVADGRVAEAGSHDELVALGGLYAELYELQARAYR
jgi:ATP-binding cassette subfamily B protein